MVPPFVLDHRVRSKCSAGANFQMITAVSGLELANLLKLIPGIGTFAGMMIEAVASCSTSALGVGYSAAFHAVATRWPELGEHLESSQIMEVMRPYT